MCLCEWGNREKSYYDSCYYHYQYSGYILRRFPETVQATDINVFKDCYLSDNLKQKGFRHFEELWCNLLYCNAQTNPNNFTVKNE